MNNFNVVSVTAAALCAYACTPADAQEVWHSEIHVDFIANDINLPSISPLTDALINTNGTVFDKLLLPEDSNLAAPILRSRQTLSNVFSLYMTNDVLSDDIVQHMTSKIEATPAAGWGACQGATHLFDFKRCTVLQVAGDEVLEDALDTLGWEYDIDVGALETNGIPIIRQLPGAPAVPVHGDTGCKIGSQPGTVPNASLLLYLSDGGPGVGGEIYFPSEGIEIVPKKGSVLSFVNGNPASHHGVRPYSADATHDRFVVQIPLLQPSVGARGIAFTEFVSQISKNLPPTVPATPSPTATPTATPTSTPTATPTATATGPTFLPLRGCCRERVKGKDSRNHHGSMKVRKFLKTSVKKAVEECRKQCTNMESCTAFEAHAYGRKQRKKGWNKQNVKCELHSAPINSATRKSKSCKVSTCQIKEVDTTPTPAPV